MFPHFPLFYRKENDIDAVNSSYQLLQVFRFPMTDKDGALMQFCLLVGLSSWFYVLSSQEARDDEEGVFKRKKTLFYRGSSLLGQMNCRKLLLQRRRLLKRQLEGQRRTEL